MILTDISLKRPVFAAVTIMALIVLGAVSYVSLSVDEYPDVEFPFVMVQVNYQGANPEQVDSKIIQKVEEAVGSVSGVKHISSTAGEGYGFTFVEFTLETSPSVAAQDVRDKLGKIRGELPQDADEPIIMRWDPNQEPIVQLALTGSMSLRELTVLADDVIKPRLEAVNGVGSVGIDGSAKREIDIELDKDKLAAFNLTIPEVVNNLKGENLEVPGGKLTQGQREVSLRTMGNLTSAKDFLNVPIGRKEGLQLYVSNIAATSDTTKEMTSISRLDGKEAISINITKQSGSNIVRVSEEIKKRVTAFNKELPKGAKLTLVQDSSQRVRESVNDVLFNLIIGGLLAVVIVFIFLGNWRSTLISAITIPASIVATFFTMKLMNFSINTMSLLALSLAVGILIDDAIVVIENIVRHMEMGKNKFKAAAEATQEIGLAVTATTLTLVAVFVPVAMMTGIAGQFFKQFGLTVAFSVLVSLFIAFTLTPMLSAKFLDISHGQKVSFLDRSLGLFNKHFDMWTERYSQFLHKVLRHRFKLLAMALVLFIGSFLLVPLLGSDFMPRSDRGEFFVYANLDTGVSVDGAAAIGEQMTEILQGTPEVIMVKNIANVDKVSLFVKLKAKGERKHSVTEVMTDLRERFNKIPGIRVGFMETGAVHDEYPIQIVLKGPSLDTLSEYADKVKTIMENTPGAVDVLSSYKPGKPDAQIQIKRAEAADLGVSTSTIADTMNTLFNGITISQFKDEDDRYDVKLRLKKDNRTTFADFEGIYVPSQYKDKYDKTVLVPLGQVTEKVYATSPSEINRYDRQKQITLTANLLGVTLGDFNKALYKQLEAIQMPTGYTIVSVGESENMDDTFTSMLMAIILAVSFIFFVLAAQFESYIDPFAIMLALPLAIIGAILGLLVMHSSLSIMSMIGIIMLMGLVTKNAILLVDFAKQRMAQGESCNEALVNASRIRMRPIMMTTAAMIFGMLPLALGIGPGAEGRASMAHAIIGGLITSTLLTLVVVPVVYSLLADLKQRLAKRKLQTPSI
jgi:HAE1 family hydrophobic/amphiphilic exporter-1